MKRQTLIRKIVEQIGEAGLFVQLPGPEAKYMLVGNMEVSTMISVKAVTAALSMEVLLVVKAITTTNLNGTIVVKIVLP